MSVTNDMDEIQKRRESFSESNWGYSIGPLGSVIGQDEAGLAQAMNTGRRGTLGAFSDVTNLMAQRGQEDDVTQLGNDHYMIRRRATKIYVRGFPQMDRLEALHENAIDGAPEEEAENPAEGSQNHSASALFSSLYALHIVLLMVVLKTTQFTTGDVDAVIIDNLFLALYVISLVWTVACRPLATACYQHKAKIGFAKSNHVNNRWLKGVLSIFGLAIIIKDGLEFIAFLGIDNPLCEDKALYATVPVIHAIFIICQVNFLFQYSKVFIQDYQVLSRFGVMHVIATNMAIWIATIADETAAALMYTESHSPDHYVATTAPEVHKPLMQNATSLPNDLPTSELYTGYRSFSPAHYPEQKAGGTDILFSGNCTCEQSFCAVVAVAEAFLFPFVIEFSLVACCLLYVTWRNVGKVPPMCQHIVKPSYKFYRSYKGAILGGFAIFACVVVLVVLGTNNSGLPADERSYFTEYNFLIIYNIFLIVFELTMIAACFFGFYLYKRQSRPAKSESDDEPLDTVLLLVCLVGPVTIGIFNVIANSIGSDNKEVVAWWLNIIWPVCDVSQCVIQVVFILYGLKQEPVKSQDDLDTAAEVNRRVRTATARSAPSEFEDDRTADGQSFYRYRQQTSSVTALSGRMGAVGPLRPAAVVAASLSAAKSPVTPLQERMRRIQTDLTEEDEPEDEKEAGDGANSSQCDEGNSPDGNPPVEASNDVLEAAVLSNGGIRDHNANDPKPGKVIRRLDSDSGFDNTVFVDDVETGRSEFGAAATFQGNAPTKFKVVAETKVAHPDRSRLLLRNVVIFLLIANACLWMFWSLEGTAFLVYTYPYWYYTQSVWTTIAMICRPLSIFFRMHSAACLFEIWSFA